MGSETKAGAGFSSMLNIVGETSSKFLVTILEIMFCEDFVTIFELCEEVAGAMVEDDGMNSDEQGAWANAGAVLVSAFDVRLIFAYFWFPSVSFCRTEGNISSSFANMADSASKLVLFKSSSVQCAASKL